MTRKTYLDRLDERQNADPERNMYGCTPCPACGGTHRYPHTEDGKKVICCDDCGRRGPWDGTWADDGFSVDESPPK